MFPVVSVIIPVYNTGKYLDKCIESVINQTVGSLQIILVDDGSTDVSAALCDIWKERDNRITVIHKVNEGLGYTRNAGLDVAKGEYISFLDSDDTLDRDTYEKCIELMTDENADACYFGRKTMDKEGNLRLNPNIPKKLVFKENEVKELFAKRYLGLFMNEEKDPFIQASACCVLYKRSIIEENNIRFCSEREYLSEDRFFNLDVCRKASCVCILPEYLYNYTYNPVSLTKQYCDKKFAKIKRMYDKLQEYVELYSEVEHVKERTQALFIGYTRALVITEVNAMQYNGFVKTYSEIRKLCTDEMLQLIYQQFPSVFVDLNSKIYMYWVRKKFVMLLIFYYALIKKYFGVE